MPILGTNISNLGNNTMNQWDGSKAEANIKKLSPIELRQSAKKLTSKYKDFDDFAESTIRT